ncbi:hypothetical protein K1Y80_14080 [Streptomyces sp. MAG02]|nr:hypothetical protein [Streptomyces sp. MAG02]
MGTLPAAAYGGPHHLLRSWRTGEWDERGPEDGGGQDADRLVRAGGRG